VKDERRALSQLVRGVTASSDDHVAEAVAVDVAREGDALAEVRP
jgi:hypothetical protein